MSRLRGIINSHGKRAVLCIMAAAAIIQILGCDKSIKITTGLRDDVIFNLSGSQCSLSQIMIVLINEKNMYERDFGQGIWNKSVQNISMEESVKEGIKEQQVYVDAMYLFAKDKDIALNKEEEEKISQAAQEYFDTLTDTEKSIINVTLDDIKDIYRKSLMSRKVYDSIAGRVEYEVSDEEARVMSVMYIYINGKDEASHAKVTEAYNKIAAGGDFYTVATEYSDDEIIQIDLGRDEFVEEIEAAAFELKADEHTGVLETKQGYYIVKCVENYIKDKTESNKILILTSKQNEEFLKAFNPFLENLELDFNNKAWDSIKLSDYGQCTTVTLFQVYNKYFE